MGDIIYTVIENGVIVDTIVADEESIELSGRTKSLVRLAALRKGAVACGRVKIVMDSGDFILRSTALSDVDDTYKDMWLVLLDNEHKFMPRRIGRYNGATKRVQFTGTHRAGPFPNTVEPGDKWIIIDRDSRDNT